MNDLLNIAKRLEEATWVPHVVKEGSREHVTVFGAYDDGAQFTTINWCTSPFCEQNRREVARLAGLGIDVVACQPPPRLRALIAKEGR